MNNKLNSLLSTIAITCAVGVPLSLTAVHELPVQASLTAPASYDYGYVWNSSTSTQNYISANGTSPTSVALFTRTTDGAYYNYSHTFSNSGSHSNTANYDLPDGLDITMTFNRSNTSWTDSSPTYTGYYPTENKIGSDATVGSVSNKLYLKFNNQTTKDYLLNLDISSTSSGVGGANYEFQDNTNVLIYFPRTEGFQNFYLPSYTNLEFYFSSTSTSRYFDAWYLKDLGVSASYDAGYDAGYEVGEADGYEDGLSNNPNILINAVESLIGMFVNFTFILFSLDLFGVSILSIVGVLFGIIAIVWILKTIRGG